MGRTWVLPWLVAALAIAGATGIEAGTGTGTHTAITIWAGSAAPPPAAVFGGMTYGGYAPPSGAMVTEQRDVEIPANGEVRITGVAPTLDPASVQLRSMSDPNGIAISEQRFMAGATTPDEILARHIGDLVTVVTPKGEVSGVLRSVDVQALVIEVGTGDQRRLQVLRRDGFVLDVHLPAGASVDKPSLVWRLAAKKPGKQTIEVTYRADGMTWSADYLAILDEAAKTIEFSAWATVKNATGTAYDNAELTLVNAMTATAVNPYIVAPPRQTSAPARFVVPGALHLGNGESVQVELMPTKTGVKARSVVTYEAMPDPSANFQAFPATECSQLSTSAAGTGRAEVALEVEVPLANPLPDGRVRLFRRRASHLEVVSEDPLRTTAGAVRIRLSPDSDIIGERHALSCTNDERTRTLHEKVEVKLENKGKQAVDVIAREFLWRWPMWKIDPADETQKGVRAAAQAQEYKVNLPSGAKKSFTYTVVYSW